MHAYIVAGDVHGNLAGLYEVASQLAEKFSLDLLGILQAGDIGAYGPDSALDKATRRHAKKDPTELDFLQYVEGTRRAAFPTWFVRGNHDDPTFLADNPRPDPAGQLRFLRDGEVLMLPGGLRIAALGGIDPGGPPPRSPFKARARMTPESVDVLLAYDGPPVDILLCHDGPKGYCLDKESEAGSEFVELATQALSPKFVFFAHYNHVSRPGKLGDTWVVPLNQPDVLAVPNRDGGVGVLEVSSGSFSFVAADGHRLVPLQELAKRPERDGP